MADLLHDIFIKQDASIRGDILTDNDYPEFNHHWTGKVIDNNDPLMMGRVKIKIFGYYDNIAEDAIPWALPENSYIGSKNGALIIPDENSILRGYFDNGDDQKPIYTSIAPSVTNYTTAKTYTDSMLNYPNLMTLLTVENGGYVTVNKQNGEVIIQQRAGTRITIDPTGSITIKTSRYEPLSTDDGNLTINLDGSFNLNTSKGTINIKSTMSDINIAASKDSVLNLGADAVDKESGGKTVKSKSKQHANNLPACVITGGPHCTNLSNNVYI